MSNSVPWLMQPHFRSEGVQKTVDRYKVHQELVNEVFLINGKYVLVEGIPASIYVRCGEATFSRETTERIRRMVYGEAQPVRAVAMEVFVYA